MADLPLPKTCIHLCENQLYIHPDECIDCGACVPACPVEAIFENDEVPEKWKNYIEIDAQYYATTSDDAERPVAHACRIGLNRTGSALKR